MWSIPEYNTQSFGCTRELYTGGPKSKPLQNYTKNILNHIKAAAWQ